MAQLRPQAFAPVKASGCANAALVADRRRLTWSKALRPAMCNPCQVPAWGRKEDVMEDEAKDRSFKETIEVAGSQIIDQVKRLIQEGNVRQLKIQAKDSDFSLEMPMTVGVLVGGAVALTAPWLAVLGVIAALVTKVEIEVEREVPKAGAPESGKSEPEKAKEPVA
jgi:Domain of unknown function (DUF4342)